MKMSSCYEPGALSTTLPSMASLRGSSRSNGKSYTSVDFPCAGPPPYHHSMKSRVRSVENTLENCQSVLSATTQVLGQSRKEMLEEREGFEANIRWKEQEAARQAMQEEADRQSIQRWVAKTMSDRLPPCQGSKPTSMAAAFKLGRLSEPSPSHGYEYFDSGVEAAFPRPRTTKWVPSPRQFIKETCSPITLPVHAKPRLETLFGATSIATVPSGRPFHFLHDSSSWLGLSRASGFKVAARAADPGPMGVITLQDACKTRGQMLTRMADVTGVGSFRRAG